MLQHHPSVAVFASDEVICFHLHVWSLVGLSFCSYVKTPSKVKIEDSLAITSFPPKQSTTSCSLLDFKQMLLIQRENSTTEVGYVKTFDFIFTKSQT